MVSHSGTQRATTFFDLRVPVRRDTVRAPMSTFKCCGFSATVTPHYDPDSTATGYESRVSIPFDYDSVTLCAYGDSAAECRARLRAKVTALRAALAEADTRCPVFRAGQVVAWTGPKPLSPGHRARSLRGGA